MGGFGAPDRGGSREGKKSLRGNKQAIAKKLKDEQRGHVVTGPRPTVSEPAPLAAAIADDSPLRSPLVDCGAQLINRQFDRDQLKVLRRAQQCGVGPIVAYTTDFDKIDMLVRCARESAGVVYCFVGVHTDNIKRNNDKLSAARLDQLRDYALRPEAVAVMAGLDYSRDIGIRYAQERALVEQMELAASVGLPLVLYEVRAAEVLAEHVATFRAGCGAATPIAIFNFAGSQEELKAFLGHGCYITLTGRACEPNERGERLRQQAAADIPRDRLLIASDSPFTTPQNIPDVYVREQRNEPSNLPSVVDALAPALGISPAELAVQLRANALAFLGIREAGSADQPTEAEQAGTAGAGTAGAGAGTAGTAEGGGASSARGAACGARAGGAAATARSGGDQGDSSDDDGSDGDDDDGDDDDSGGEGSEGDGQRGGSGTTARARAAGNRFALMRLEGEGEVQQEGEGGQDDPEEGEGPAAGPASSSCTAETRTTQARPAEGQLADGDHASSRRRAERIETSRRKKAEGTAEAEAAARDGAAAAVAAPGPRLSYACRGCRTVLATEADVVPHAGAEELDRADFKQRRRGQAGRNGDKHHGGVEDGGLCSMHFLRGPLAWMQQQQQACTDAGGAAEGRLACPSCAAKLGKWATGGGGGGGAAGGGGGGAAAAAASGLEPSASASSAGARAAIQCSCGVLVPAPAYGLLKSRLDIIDTQLDLAAVVQSTLQAYGAEDGPAGGGSSDSDGGGGRRKKRAGKQKLNKTANFSSFRNKDFGVNQKRRVAKVQRPQAAAGASAGQGGVGMGPDGDDSVGSGSG